MKINSNSRKLLLTILIAYGGVLWLNVWHQIGHSHGTIGLSPLLYWLRDSIIILLPVMLAVWTGTAITQWLSDRSNGRMSPFAQSSLSVVLMGLLTSVAFIMIESNHSLRTGIGNDFALEVSICRTINSASYQMVETLFRSFSDFQIARIYVLLKDGISLILANMGITVLLTLTLSELEKQLGPDAAPKAKKPILQPVKNVRILPAAVIAFSLMLAYGGSLWLTILHPANGASWIQDASMFLPLVILSVIIALRISRLLLDRYGEGASKLLESTIIISLVALISSIALGLGSTILNIWSQTHHQVGGKELSQLAHWGYEGLLSLVASSTLTALVYTLLQGNLWTDQPIQSLPWQVPYAKLGRQFTALGLAVVMIPSLLGLANGDSVFASGPSTCPASAPVKTFDVSAIDVTIWLDRFGVHDPNAHMYVLDSMIPAVRAQEAAGPSSLSIGLRDDPIQPLAIRANQGDCVVINFTNNASAAVDSTSSTYGMHIDGLADQP